MRPQRGKSRRRASILTILKRFLRLERCRFSNHATCAVDRLGLTLAKPVVQTVLSRLLKFDFVSHRALKSTSQNALQAIISISVGVQ